jgi:hypothetical protein
MKRENLHVLGFLQGPKEPEKLIEDVVNQFQNFAQGIQVLDHSSNLNITVKAHLLTIGGDLAALHSILHLTSFSGKMPCRVCNIESVWSVDRAKYYPCLKRPYDMIDNPNGVTEYANRLN